MAGQDLRSRFRDVVTSENELRAVVGPAQQRALDKVVRTIDGQARAFIARSPFLFLATRRADGRIDVTPRGDPPGFVRVLDDATLAIPDRPGNKRIDTFRNLLADPHIGLIFIVPGITHTLRVHGEAVIVRDPELRESMAEQGKVPDHALVVGVTEVMSHCPKCMLRAGLWQVDTWPGRDALPSFAEMLKAHTQMPAPVDDIQAMIDRASRETLY
ncbi:MAG: MSMEG_1061 family FMN-dependent PPOX-type flavoprotein [Geminicoccaceae bacterium]